MHDGGDARQSIGQFVSLEKIGDNGELELALRVAAGDEGIFALQFRNVLFGAHNASDAIASLEGEDECLKPDVACDASDLEGALALMANEDP